MSYQMPKPGSGRPSLSKGNSAVFVCPFCSYQHCRQQRVQEHARQRHMMTNPTTPAASGDAGPSHTHDHAPTTSQPRTQHRVTTPTPKPAPVPKSITPQKPTSKPPTATAPNKVIQTTTPTPASATPIPSFPCKECPFVAVTKRSFSVHQTRIHSCKKQKLHHKGLTGGKSSRKGPEYYGQPKVDSISLFGSDISSSTSEDEEPTLPIHIDLSSTSEEEAEEMETLTDKQTDDKKRTEATKLEPTDNKTTETTKFTKADNKTTETTKFSKADNKTTETTKPTQEDDDKMTETTQQGQKDIKTKDASQQTQTTQTKWRSIAESMRGGMLLKIRIREGEIFVEDIDED